MANKNFVAMSLVSHVFGYARFLFLSYEGGIVVIQRQCEKCSCVVYGLPFESVTTVGVASEVSVAVLP